MSKNLTIKDIVTSVTAICGVFLVLFVLALKYFNTEKLDLTTAIVLVVVGVVAIYLVVSLLLKRFVLDRLGLIYNFIQDTRLKNSELKKEKLKKFKVNQIMLIVSKMN